MRRIWVLALVLVLLMGSSLLAQAPRKAIMVVDFANRVGGWSGTGEAVTNRVIARLRDDATLRVLPRDRVQEALATARVERSGVLDIEDAQKVAKTLEADYAIMGEVSTFDQNFSGGCLPIVGCAYTITATVGLGGKVLDVAGGVYVGTPGAEVRKQQSSVSVWVGPWWTSISFENFDNQLIGKATLEAVDQFVAKAKPLLK